MARKTKMTAESLARKFAELLAEDIGDAAMAEVVRRNGTVDYDEGSCASHDFCDANMVMLAAVESFGYSDDDVFENDCDNEVQKLWNAAWDFAKSNKFFIFAKV